jgi:hypothetical protein
MWIKTEPHPLSPFEILRFLSPAQSRKSMKYATPQRQKAASFNLDEVLQKLKESAKD